ncbi:hypothetical protein, partial [Bacillus pumilus]|uniref:hypothetical protein n=1 Tax=Bacillus pumilus TaxID=1408 RepID=UPI0021B2E956
MSYIQPHPTPTTLPHPLQIHSLNKPFQTDKKHFSPIPSLKTNIPHLHSPPPLPPFINTTLTLYHHLLPPTLHYKKPNPKIHFESTPFYLN